MVVAGLVPAIYDHGLSSDFRIRAGKRGDFQEMAMAPVFQGNRVKDVFRHLTSAFFENDGVKRLHRRRRADGGLPARL